MPRARALRCRSQDTQNADAETKTDVFERPADWRKVMAAKRLVLVRVVCSVPGFELVRSSALDKFTPAAESERASTLIPKIAVAMNRPGISKDAVFQGLRRGVYSYSIDTADITRIVRVDADGNRTVGRLVGNRFRAVRG